jgi:protoheme IX farnesyltransferase
MSTIGDMRAIATAGPDAAPLGARVADYLALLKPRVMSLVVFTAIVGLVAAPAPVHPVLATVSILMIALGAGASGALNMWWDADIDRVMTRTRGRPVARRAIEPAEALAFGVVLSLVSVVVLGLAANWVAAGLLAFTIFFYVVVYTMWLKRRTPQNIVIGGAAGAFPPMIGWAVVTGGFAVPPLVMFLIVFLWTPPHFWALALYKSDDYARAGVPMLPVVAGPDETRRQILLYTALYLPATLGPVALGFGGLLFAAGALAAGAVFAVLAWRVFREREGKAAVEAARALFAYSILHLFLIFVLLLAEHGFGLRLGGLA